jgi:hypothetical protein
MSELIFLVALNCRSGAAKKAGCFSRACGAWVRWPIRRCSRSCRSAGCGSGGRDSRTAYLRSSGIVLSSTIFFLVLAPWLVRNYEVFGRFVFLRDDFGLQFRLGNWKGAEGMLMAYLQPNLNKLEFEKFQRMGELAYAADCKRLAFEWVRENPNRFAVISLKRFFYYWNGVPKPSTAMLRGTFATRCFWHGPCSLSGAQAARCGRRCAVHGFSRD